MRYTVLTIPALLLGLTCQSYAQAQKIGIINFQAAIQATKDGQKAAADLNAKFAPVKDRLQKKQTEIESDKARLSSGANVMSADQKEKLMREIDQKTTSLNRDAQDAQADVDQESGKLMQELGGRLMAVLNKYAKDKGYTLVLDVGSQQSPVLYAPDDITEEIIKLYDQNAPAPGSSAAPASAAPGASRPAATTPSPMKKAPAPKQP